MGAGCSKEIVHQSGGTAKGIAGILLRWYCQLVDSPEENCEMEVWENGWEEGQNGPGRDETKTGGGRCWREWRVIPLEWGCLPEGHVLVLGHRKACLEREDTVRGSYGPLV